MPFPPIKKHPLAVAWEQWLESEEGKKAADPSMVRASHAGSDREYLRNRLHRAFEAGVEAQTKLDSLQEK